MLSALIIQAGALRLVSNPALFDVTRAYVSMYAAVYKEHPALAKKMLRAMKPFGSTIDVIAAFTEAVQKTAVMKHFDYESEDAEIAVLICMYIHGLPVTFSTAIAEAVSVVCQGISGVHKEAEVSPDVDFTTIFSRYYEFARNRKIEPQELQKHLGMCSSTLYKWKAGTSFPPKSKQRRVLKSMRQFIIDRTDRDPDII